MSNLLKSLLSLESVAPDGKTKKELELVFYVKLNDFDMLKSQAQSIETQEQYAYRQENGTIRMRAVTNKSGGHESLEDEYVLTTKVWDGVTFGKEENEVTSTKGMFEHFKKLFPEGMYKQRYKLPFTFKEAPLICEVDVFFKEDGSPQEWVKIDIELPESLLPERQNVSIPEQLGFSEGILEQFGERSPEQEAAIKSLYANEFSTKPV